MLLLIMKKTQSILGRCVYIVHIYIYTQILMILLLKLQFVLRFNVILIFPFKPFIHDSFDIFPGSNLFKVVKTCLPNWDPSTLNLVEIEVPSV